MALGCLLAGALHAECTRSVTIQSDYEKTGSSFFCCRTGWRSPVTGHYYEGELTSEWEEYTVVVPAGQMAEVSVHYDSQISNTSGRMFVFGSYYSVGSTARRTCRETTSFIVGPEQKTTLEVGGFTVRCYYTVTVRYYPISPNLQVSANSYPKKIAIGDETVTLYLTVRNVGDDFAHASAVGIYDGKQKIAEKSIDSIRPNSYAYVSLTLPKLSPGIHALSAVADIYGTVAEYDETDNSSEWTFETRDRTTYTIHYDANGGEGKIADQKMVYGTGSSLAKEGFTLDGMRLAGWSTEPTGDVEFNVGDYENAVPGAVKGMVTLYAVWKPPFVVKFDANGGTGEMPDQAMADWDFINPNAFEREGFEFCGWAVERNGMPLYADGETVCFFWCEDFHQELRDGMTLYACWGRQVQTDICPGFRFLYGGANEDRAWVESVEGGETVLSSPSFGWGESGWLRVKFVGPGNLDFDVRRSGEKCYFATSLYEEPILVAGSWLAKHERFYDREKCLSFLVPSSSRLALRRMSWTPDAAVSLGESAYSRYESEWITASAQEGTVKVSVPTLCEWTARTDVDWIHLDQTNGVCTSVIRFFVDENTTRYLRFGNVLFVNGETEVKFAVYQDPYPTVKIFMEEGNGSSPSLHDYTSALPYGYLFKPWWRGHVFLGWSYERDSDDFISEKSIVPSEDTTIYAQWKPISYTIAYDVCGGTEEVPGQMVEYDEAIELNGIRGTNEGLRFIGWATDVGGRVIYRDRQTVSNLTATADAVVKLYAVWRDIDGVAGEDGLSVFPVAPTFEGDAKFTAKGLPKGLKINAQTGEIYGKPEVPGNYTVVVTATSSSNKKKSETQEVVVNVGHYVDVSIPVAESYGPYVPGVEQVVTIAEASGCAVSGLPSGMKWTTKAVLNKDKTVRVPANSGYGTPVKPGKNDDYFTKTANGAQRQSSATSDGSRREKT